MIGSAAEPGVCEVRSETDSPCGRPATVTMPAIRLCERCAREQEAYFAVGDLTETPGGSAAGVARMKRTSTTHPPDASTGVPARLWRRLRKTATTSGKISLLLIVALASVLASAACGGSEQARGELASDPQTNREANTREHTNAAEATASGTPDGGAVARASDAKTRAGDDAVAVRTDGARGRPGTIVIEGNDKGEVAVGSESRKVTLSIKGDPGTGFSGVCSVGGKERTLEGRAPERYSFEPGDRGLECEIRKKGEGALEVVATSGEGARSVQRIAIRGGGTVEFTVSGDGVSSFSSVSVNQSTATSGRSPNSSR